MVPVELAILGPIGDYVGKGLAAGVQWLFTVSPLLAGGILAAFIRYWYFRDASSSRSNYYSKYFQPWV